MPSFNAISRRYTKIVLLAQEKYKFCKQGGKLDYSRYSQVHVSLLTLCYHWQSFIWGATNIYTYMYTNTDRFTLLALHVQGNN